MSEIASDQESTERLERHARMRVLAEEAMADPDFVSDLNETRQAFQYVDRENWPLYDEQAASE